jgi:hypothetical protein
MLASGDTPRSLHQPVSGCFAAVTLLLLLLLLSLGPALLFGFLPTVKVLFSPRSPLIRIPPLAVGFGFRGLGA